MRLLLLSTLTLLASTSLTTAARADTFSFAPANGGKELSFTTGSPFRYDLGKDVVYLVSATNGDSLQITFSSSSSGSISNGFADLSVGDLSANIFYLESGPQLYTGSESSPVFMPSTFSLASDNVFMSEADVAATLVIDGGAPSSVTPEPSTIVLLGTGLIGALGVTRRRLLHAN